MALPLFEKDMNIIAKLSNEPNNIKNEGLNDYQLKDKFDEGGEALKEYINGTLLPYLEGVQAAASLGIATISGISGATNVQEALEALKQAIDNTSTGAIPDESLSGIKLIAKTITAREMADGSIGKSALIDGAVADRKVADNGITKEKLADLAVEARHLNEQIISDENIMDNSIDASGKLKSGTLTSKLFAAQSVPEMALVDKAVSGAKIADDTITGKKIALGTIVCGKYSIGLAKDAWTLNSYGLYEQTKTISGGFDPERHIGLLGHTRGLSYYPGDGNTSWGWSQALIDADREKMACLYSAKLIAVDTIKFVATEVPASTLYVTILFFRR